MTEPLQEFGWKQSQYERPTHGWVCGRLCDGSPCSLGPTARGRCSDQAGCTPKKSGDGFVCTRSAAQGGVCQNGPELDGSCCTPQRACRPRRTIQQRRRIVSVVVAFASLAFCLYVFGGTQPTVPLSPGSVTFQHSAIEHECGSCHVAAADSDSSLLQTALDSGTAFHDGRLCLKCHSDIGPNPFLAHGFSANELAGLTQQAQSNEQKSPRSGLLALASMFDSSTPDQQLACAACHHEHHGQLHDLTRIADLRCQSCHSKQFHSFADGHPELTTFPYSRRTRIYFDHARHLQQYFQDDEMQRLLPDARVPQGCTSCHILDPAGDVMVTRGFEQMCASCHDDGIVDRELPGVAFLAVPPFTVDASADTASIPDPGDWPNPSGVSGVRQLPAFMKILLAGDEEFQNAQTKLHDFAPADLASAPADLKQDVETYLKSIKRLFEDLAHNGDAAIATRVGHIHAAPMSLSPSPVPSVHFARHLWFSNATREMSENADAPMPDRSLTLSESQLSGWYVRENDMTIRYRPSGHADPLLREWLDGSVRFLSEPGMSVGVDDLLRQLGDVTGSGTGPFAGPVASGRCLQCHTIDQDENGNSSINWFARLPGQASSRLTNFAHSPHMQQQTEQGCVSCHTISQEQPSGVFRAAFLKRDAHSGSWKNVTDWQQVRTSGFTVIRKETCAKCHTQSAAGDSCLKCHNYHAHAVTGRIPKHWHEASAFKQLEPELETVNED